MNLESKNCQENGIEKKQVRAFEDLTVLERNAIVALCLSNTIREASKKYKAMTGRSISDFWNNIYPGIKDTWRAYSENVSEMALMRLRAGAMDAVDEMIEEVKHYDVEIRHKASKVIIDTVVAPKKEKEVPKGNVFNAPVQFNFDKYKK